MPEGHQPLGTAPEVNLGKAAARHASAMLAIMGALMLARPAFSADASKSKPPVVVLPTVFIFLDAETSGSGFQEQLDRLGAELKLRLVEQGLSAPDLFKPDSPSTRRALAEKTIGEKDLKQLGDMGAIVRLCQGMSRRFGLVVRILRVEGTVSALTSLDTKCIVVDALSERQEEFGIRSESFELAADERGKKPTLYTLAARRIAMKVKDELAGWPVLTMEASQQKAEQHAARAETRAKDGDFSGAIEEINQSIALAPRDSRHYLRAGDYYAKSGDAHFAIVQYRRALLVNAEDAETHLRLARILVGQKDLLEAARSARSAIQIGPDSAEARKIIAQALLARREAVFASRPEEARQALEEAIKHLRRASELNPQDVELSAQVATLMYHNGQFTEAVGLWSRVVKARPADAAAREQFAQALYQARKYEEAFDEFQRAWADRPRPLRLESETYRRLGWLVDRKTVQVFRDSRSVLEDLEGGKLSREQALVRFGKIRKEAAHLGSLLDDLQAPTAQAAPHAHRRLAYSIFDQALAAYQTYLDTDDMLYRDRGMVLQTQAATEYDLAQGRSTS